jgi:hypothetical protein
VLVPQAHTEDLKPYLDKLKLVNGYLVSKDAPTTSSVYEQAQNAAPDISYLTMNVGIKQMMQMGEPQQPSTGAPATSSPAKSTTKKS